MSILQATKRRLPLFVPESNWRNLLHSRRITGALLYIGYRSRGFVTRRATNIALDALLTLAIGLNADPVFFRLAIVLNVTGVLVAVFGDAVFFALRAAALTYQSYAPRLLVFVYVACMATATFGWLLFSRIDLVENSLQILFVLARVATLIAGIYTEAHTANQVFGHRVYYPPLLNLWILLTAGVGVLGTSALPPGIGTAAAILLFFALRVGNQMYYLRLVKHATARIRLEALRQLSATSRRLRLMPFLWRVCFRSSIYVPIPLIYLVMPEIGHNLSYLTLLAAWLSAIIERPFRAIAVDVFQLFRASEFGAIRAKLSQSYVIATALFSMLFCLVLIFLGFGWFNLPAGICFVVFFYALNGMIVLGMGVIGQDAALAKSASLIRVGEFALFVVLSHMLRESALIVLCCGEALVVTVLLVKISRSSIRQCMEFDAAESEAAEALCTKFQPGSTLQICRYLSMPTGVDDASSIVLKLKLRHPSPSAAKVQLYLNDLRKVIRASDQVLVFGSDAILIFAFFACSSDQLISRLWRSFPLRLEAIELVRGGLREVLVGPRGLSTTFAVGAEHQVSLKQIVSLVHGAVAKGDSQCLLASLSRLLELMQAAHTGEGWLVLGENDVWLSANGEIPVLNARFCEFLRRKLDVRHNLLSDRTYQEVALNRRFYLPIFSVGRVIGFLTSDTPFASSTVAALSRFNTQLLVFAWGEALVKPTEELSAPIFFRLRAAVVELAKRHKNLQVAEGVDPVKLVTKASPRANKFWTSDGYGSCRWIELETSTEASESIAAERFAAKKAS